MEEKSEYDLRGETVNFEERRLRILGRDSMKRLRRLHKIAKESGLHKMTMKEIDAEIKAYRDEKRRR